MEFRILGPLEVLEDGRQIDLGGAKQRALLATLLLHANEVVSQDRLIEALWEEQPPETAQKALQVYASRLRKMLGKERLETKVPVYRLRLAEGELDLERFQRLAEERPREALSLWRGEPLAEFSYQRFAQRLRVHVLTVPVPPLAVTRCVQTQLRCGLSPDAPPTATTVKPSCATTARARRCRDLAGRRHRPGSSRESAGVGH